MSVSFPKQNRLVTKFEFSVLFEGSIKISQKYMLALYKQNTKEQARLGVVVGKRVAPHAVTRNKIKRVIRESFRLHQTLLPGIDIVVIARQQSDKLDKIQLRKGIDNLWQSLLTQYQKSLR